MKIIEIDIESNGESLQVNLIEKGKVRSTEVFFTKQQLAANNHAIFTGNDTMGVEVVENMGCGKVTVNMGTVEYSKVERFIFEEPSKKGSE